MAEYLHEIDEEEFNNLAKLKLEDDKKVMEWLQRFIDEEDDRRFNFVLLNLGTIMKICAVELEFKAEEIEHSLKLEKDKARDRKMAFILKELNKKINLRYDFDDKTQIVSTLYTYDGLGYIFVNKTTFVELLYEKDIDIETLDNV